MNRHARLLAACLGAMLFAAQGSDGALAAQRHFVASNGVDTNPCSITLPCRSFEAAALVVDPNGEIIVQDTAGYGFVIVTKPLSILSPYGVYAGISVFAGTDGVTINAPGGGVRLTGVYINGQGGSIGINVQNASKVTIEGSSVTNMASHGLSATSASAHIVIRNTVFRDNGGAGITIVGAAETTIDAVHADRNGSMGIALNGTKGTISGSVTNDNGGHGISITAPSLTTATLAISDHASANNVGSGVDAFVNSAAQVYVTLSRSALSGNTQHGAHAPPLRGRAPCGWSSHTPRSRATPWRGSPRIRAIAVASLHGNTVSNSPIGVQGLAGAQVRSVRQQLDPRQYERYRRRRLLYLLAELTPAGTGKRKPPPRIARAGVLFDADRGRGAPDDAAHPVPVVLDRLAPSSAYAA